VESDSFQQLTALFHQFKVLWKVTRREKLDRQFARGTIWSDNKMAPLPGSEFRSLSSWENDKQIYFLMIDKE
jgi:hypothetical protein